MKKLLTQKYLENGVSWTKAPKKAQLKIQYSGMLAKAGAEEVYLHLGYGEHWEDSILQPMLATQNGFEIEIPLAKSLEPINLCFKDNAGNWDNNNGCNYQYEK